MKKFFKCVIGFAVLLFLSCKQDEELVVFKNIQVFNKKNTIYPGDELKMDDVQIIAHYSNGDSRDITEMAVFSPSLPKTIFADDNEIEVFYKDDKCVFEVFVEGLSEIFLILSEPDRIFYEGDELSSSDFVVMAKYVNGYVGRITNGVSFSGLGKLSAGRAVIKAEYKYKANVVGGYRYEDTSLEILVYQKENPLEEIPDALYIVGSFSYWNFVAMEKDENCFSYEFEDSFEGMGTLEFKITTDAVWADGDNEVFAGSIVPSTGLYVAPRLSSGIAPIDNAKINIAHQGDKIYVRYENGICYARYVEAGEYVSPSDEMKVVDALQIELGDFPEYVFAGERLTVAVFEDAYVPCDYTYQWYRYEISDSEIKAVPVYGATSRTFQGFIEGDFYCFSVTATQRANPKNKAAIKTPACYVDKDIITVSLSQEEITLNSEVDWEILTANTSTWYYDDIFWSSSNPSVAAICAGRMIGSRKFKRWGMEGQQSLLGLCKKIERQRQHALLL